MDELPLSGVSGQTHVQWYDNLHNFPCASMWPGKESVQSHNLKIHICKKSQMYAQMIQVLSQTAENFTNLTTQDDMSVDSSILRFEI